MGVVIASGFTAGNTYALNTPRIGWRRIPGTITPSTEAAGFAAANAGTNRTDSFWRPTALPATWEIDAGFAHSVSYCGIAAHDLGTQGCTVLVQSSPDGVTWTTRCTIIPTDDTAIFALFATVSAQYWQLSISGSGDEPTIGVIQFGAVTEFPQRASYAPSMSFERTRVASYSTNRSEGGQWLGRSVSRVSLAPTMQVSHLSETWVAAEWDAFAEYAEAAPFFVADRPNAFPKSCCYAWTGGDLRAERSLPNAAVAMSISLEMTGFLA
jgi:hypothetical protein